MSNITQFVSNEKNLTTLKKSIYALGLNQILSSIGSFTLFAPSDLAFEKLDDTVLMNLQKQGNRILFADLLCCHIVSGKINFTDLKDGEKLETINGRELVVQVKNGKVSIEGATIENGNVQASNGIIHFLDAVIRKN